MTRKSFLSVSESFMQVAGHIEALIFSKLLYVYSIPTTDNTDCEGYRLMTLSKLEDSINATPMQVRYGLTDLASHGMIALKITDNGTFRFRITATPTMIESILGENGLSFWEKQRVIGDETEINAFMQTGIELPIKKQQPHGFPKRYTPEEEAEERRKIRELERKTMTVPASGVNGDHYIQPAQNTGNT
ncbi:hypothetical protein EOM82_09905 [bacterium]|nr:hypothetical protein [bacterium]